LHSNFAFSPLRVSLDSNILFSASLYPNHRFLEFWRMYGVTPMAAHYSLGEVRRNIGSPEHRHRFEALVDRTLIVNDAPLRIIPAGIEIVLKDQPILATALYAAADFLITGDTKHFRHLYGRKIGSLQTLPANTFLDRFEYRLIS
jgi:predicted nucleic acid-binding protein